MQDPDRLVTVCDHCLCASCWHGEFMCDDAHRLAQDGFPDVISTSWEGSTRTATQTPSSTG